MRMNLDGIFNHSASSCTGDVIVAVPRSSPSDRLYFSCKEKQEHVAEAVFSIVAPATTTTPSMCRFKVAIPLLKPNYSELLSLEYVSLPCTSVFCRFALLSITEVIYIFVVRRGAPPSNCDVTKALWRQYHSENGELRKRC